MGFGGNVCCCVFGCWGCVVLFGDRVVVLGDRFWGRGPNGVLRGAFRILGGPRGHRGELRITSWHECHDTPGWQIPVWDLSNREKWGCTWMPTGRGLGSVGFIGVRCPSP